MDTEELKLEARQKALEWNGEKINGKYNRPPIANWSCYEKGYLAGAEPREKRITELEKACDETQELLDKQIEATYKLQKENAELKERLLKVENAYKRKSEAEWRMNDLYQKSLTDYVNAEKCSREYFTRYRTLLDRCIKAEEIIKKFSEFVSNEIEYDPEHPQEHTDLWNELCKQSEQFLKEVSE